MWITNNPKTNYIMKGPFTKEVSCSLYYSYTYGPTFSDWLIPGTFVDEDE